MAEMKFDNHMACPSPGVDYQTLQSFQNPPYKGEKELLLLAVYLNVETQSEAKTRERVADFKESFSQTCDRISRETKYKIYTFVLPVRDQNTKIECLLPRNVEDNIIGKLEGLLP